MTKLGEGRSTAVENDGARILDLSGGRFSDQQLACCVAASVSRSGANMVDLQHASFSVDGLLRLADLPNLKKVFTYGAWGGLDIGENERQRLRCAFGDRISFSPREE